MPVLTPNMALLQPVIGTDTGLTWEQSTNANALTIDGHDHSSGKGAPITQAGFSLTGDFPFNSFNALSLRSTRFTVQPSPISGASDLGCLYVSGVDLYYNDVNGTPIQITSGGAVLATSSGITSGTASAAFSSSILVVLAAAATPANIKGASLLLGNNVANSNYLTLSPPSAMASNYSLVLPALPGSTKFVTLDTGGNLSTAGTISGAQLAPNTITNAQIVAVNDQASSSCGAFTSSSATITAVTNLSVTITTTGKPVVVFCQADGTANSSSFTANNTGTAVVYLYRGATLIQQYDVRTPTGGPAISLYPPSLVTAKDNVAAGTYTYTVKVAIGGGGLSTITASYMVLEAYELK